MDRIAFVNVFHGISRLRPAPSPLLNQVYHRSRAHVSRRCIISANSTPPTDTNTAPPKKSAARPKDDTSPYSATVNLPKTTFEQRANATKREPQLQQFWAENSVYERLSRKNAGEKFVLHDGPPFANGPIHCGHALNKILKDIINKHALMCGRRAVFVPGWDTHGLPIELKVLQSLKSKERRSLTTLDLRKKARKFAEETVQDHIVGMKRFGVWAEWDSPYVTMAPEYEAAQIEVFGKMFANGFVFRGRKPVHWSPSSRTALAEAELEYPESHTSRSCYCAFAASTLPDSVPQLLKDAFNRDGGLALSIWTTTPWTLPANRAISVNAKMEYTLVKGLHPKQPELVVVVAKDLVDTVCSKFETTETAQVLGSVLGAELVGVKYTHPLEDGLVCPVVEGGDYITTETGTGLVHTAPGHGQDDYQTGLREGLDLISPVDDAGKFTEEAANGRFKGLPVLGEGNTAILEAIGENKVLMLEEAYAHKYPYDWRTKKPTIFRATEQWFVSIEGFREAVLQAVDGVQWIPAAGIKRIKGMVEGRGDWCISRQRSWGVPIPVFYDDASGEVLMSEDIVKHVTSLVRERGTDVWWELEADELLPEEYRGRGLRKGRDTMDVWFDSGTSWAAVAKGRQELAYPADMYLEGSDQHRGWFQSSILTSVATQQQAPYKTVLTHGFVLDEKGVKMSKSIGNVVDPMSVINGGNNKKTDPAYGSDVLRLWVCSVDYSADSMIGPSILKQVSDVYRKLRNTVRYMIGNIYDFSPETDAVPFDELPSLDKYMLSRMMTLCDEIDAAYDSYSFFRVYQSLQRFAVVELSNFYLDIAKDRLYIPEVDAFRRRSCQTVLTCILENFAKAFAPVCSHTAEDLWQNLPYRPQSGNVAFPEAGSVFEAGWFERRKEWTNVDEETLTTWASVLDVRDAVNKVLQAARVGKTLGAPMEAHVKLLVRDEKERKMLQKLHESTNDVDRLERALIVSKVEIVDDEQEVLKCAHHNAENEEESGRFLVGMSKSMEDKCERCWHYDETVGTDDGHPLLCSRCAIAVVSMGMLAAPVEGAATAAV